MRIGIASHIVLDAIEGTDGKIHESVGGPPCYSGITSRRFEFEVSLVTRVGTDFPAQMHQLLRENNLILKDLQIVNAPTTKFSISQEEGRSRKMVLNSKCAPLSADDIKDMVNADIAIRQCDVLSYNCNLKCAIVL